MKSKNNNSGCRKQTVLGQASWRLASRQVEAYVTELGGHLGPVTFHLPGRDVRPYSVAPWAEEKTDPGLIPLLKVLRGDFFCLPFGGNATAFRGEKHPVHGETANARWTQVEYQRQEDRRCLHLRMKTRVRQGSVDKRIYLIPGHHALYSEHLITGMSGPMNLGHHAMLKFPDEPGSGLISTSPFELGRVFPQAFEKPEEGGYSHLQPGATFKSLSRVPTSQGTVADLTRYPARRGFEDLVMMVGKGNLPFSWTAVVFPRERYVWFALKDPRVLRHTIFWISNGGRHYAPWNGRHVSVMGLEEVTSNFHLGLAESARPNALTKMGYPTCLRLKPNQSQRVAYIMAVAFIPRGFNHVASIQAVPGQDCVRLKSANGKVAMAPLRVDFLTSSPA